jgi:hypothetical protein
VSTAIDAISSSAAHTRARRATSLYDQPGRLGRGDARAEANSMPCDFPRNSRCLRSD